MKRRSKLIGKAFCCCEVTVGFSRNGRGNGTRRPELRRCGRKRKGPTEAGPSSLGYADEGSFARSVMLPSSGKGAISVSRRRGSLLS
jgi:hypothetical protein